MAISINSITRFSQTTNTQQLAQATQANIGKNKVQENAAKEIKNSNIVVERQDSAVISKEAMQKSKKDFGDLNKYNHLTEKTKKEAINTKLAQFAAKKVY